MRRLLSLSLIIVLLLWGIVPVQAQGGTWCYQYDFTSSQDGWSVLVAGVERAYYGAGDGFYHVYVAGGTELRIYRNFSSVAITAWEIDYNAPTGAYGASINFYASDVLPASTDGTFHQDVTTTLGTTSRIDVTQTGLTSLLIRRVRLYGDGTNPLGSDNCGTPTPTPSYTPSVTPTPTATFTPTLTPTADIVTPDVTPTLTSTFTPSPTRTLTPTTTYTPSNTPTITPTPNNSATPTFTPTATFTPTETWTAAPPTATAMLLATWTLPAPGEPFPGFPQFGFEDEPELLMMSIPGGGDDEGGGMSLMSEEGPQSISCVFAGDDGNAPGMGAISAANSNMLVGCFAMSMIQFWGYLFLNFATAFYTGYAILIIGLTLLSMRKLLKRIESIRKADV